MAGLPASCYTLLHFTSLHPNFNIRTDSLTGCTIILASWAKQEAWLPVPQRWRVGGRYAVQGHWC